MSVNNSMDSVFANSMADETEFDVIFGQNDDDMVDTVAGVNEEGDPLTGTDFEELHNTEDDATPADFKEEDNDAVDLAMGAKDPEGTEEVKPDDNSAEGEVGKQSDADKALGFCPIKNNADSEYQDGNEGSKVKADPDDLYGTIDKVAEGDDMDIEDEFFDDDDFEEGCSDPDKCYQDGEEEGKGEEVDPAEIEAEIDDEVKEAADMNKDVENVDSADVDGEDEIIQSAEKSDNQDTAEKYAYDPSDEEIIDLVANGEDF